jgi:hypothetical protein
MGMTVQYCQPYVSLLLTRSLHSLMSFQVRPIENMTLAVDPRRLQDIDERIVDMMGYRVHAPFIGYVDGLNPRRGAQRMVEWLQKPLELQPPTFAALENDEKRKQEHGTGKSKL